MAEKNQSMDLNLKTTELRLGPPGSESPERDAFLGAGANRRFSDSGSGTGSSMVLKKNKAQNHNSSSVSKEQQAVVGWPPIRSFRKNSMATNAGKLEGGCVYYVKVSMDGAPYLRKVDLNTYATYAHLSSALQHMFSCFTFGRDGLILSKLKDLPHSSEQCVLTYEDKDGDWMLVGDVPWDMFTKTCRRIRITKSSEAIGLAPRAMEKCKRGN